MEIVKYFWKNDEANAKCATLRPYQDPQSEDIPKLMSVEDFRRREIQMERELNRKVFYIQEKEKDGQVRVQLENMTPRITYTQPFSILYIGMRIMFTHKRKIESTESLDQLKREQSLQRVIYQRESEIPKSPLEVHSQKSYGSLKDISLIPFFKSGSYPPKIIKLIDQPIIINDEFMKIFQPPVPPPPPPMIPAQYSPIIPLPIQPGLYTGQVPQPPPPRLGPLPSSPIPQYNMPQIPIYDPAILANPMDPYSLMNKSRILYNPVTKKPQNYRTVPCRKFHSGDGCERGDNCHFIHDFQFQGRPIPNFQDWKNHNMIRQQNLQSINTYNMASYYPPPGPEAHNDRT